MVTELWVLPLASALAVTDQDEEGGLAFLSIFRLLRLLRLSRMVRLMRYLPELMTLVKGMVEAAKTVWVVFMFLFFLMFVFALIFISLIGEPGYVQPEDAEVSTAKTMFGDLGSAMLALFTHGVLWDNLYQALMEIKQEGYLLMLLFLFFSLVSGMCLLNMLIGVLCQVMHQTSHREQEVRHRRHVEETLRQAFHDVDSSSDGLVCQDEWMRCGGTRPPVNPWG
jgi:voltage-gated sodium channel